SDLDVIYGDIRSFLTDAILENDVITFNVEHLSGHFTLVRNTAAVRSLYHEIPDWKTQVCHEEYMHLDEPHPDVLRRRFNVWAQETYNTPLSTLIPWRDGTFTFPREWYWRHGQLWNDLDHGVKFLYLHFMHWKGGEWPRAC